MQSRSNGPRSGDDNYWTRYRDRALTRRTLMRGAAGATIGAAGLAMVGCGDDDDDNDASPTSTGNTAPAGTQGTATQAPTSAATTDLNRTVRMAIPDAKGGLDPHLPGNYTTRYSPAVHFDSLFQYDDVTRQYTSLLGEFEQVDDTTAIITVRPGQKWHDGTPVTAEDVKFTIDRVGGTAAYNTDGKFQTGGAYAVASITNPPQVMDDKTVKLSLKPDATVPQLLLTFRVVPKHFIESKGDAAFNQSGLGSGPFKLESYTPDTEVRSVRNDEYFLPYETKNRHKPWIKELRQLVRPESLARVAALEAGEVDAIDGLSPELIAQFEGDKDYRLVVLPGNPHIIFPNTKVPMLPDGSNPFRDIRVRKAMNHAVDVDTMISALGTGRETRSYGFGSLQLGAMTQEQAKPLTFEFDPQKAKALMEEAGYGDGFDVDLYGTTGFAALTDEIAITVQQNLRDIGIRTNLVLEPLATFRPRFAKKDVPGLYYYFSNQSPDPGQVLNAEVDEAGTLSVAVYPESGIQDKMNRQRVAFDIGERTKILNELAKEIYTNASWLFLLEPATAGVMRSNLDWTLTSAELAAAAAWAIRPTA